MAFNSIKAKPILLISFFMLAAFITKVFGQAGNIDQIRNGPANDPTKLFYNTFNNPTWVNGNAGASNAHYVEGMSISYRSLITLLTAGNQYEYVIEYDTKHSSSMAIDYLTHYQRLEPHGPFNHSAEVINPRIFQDGNREYLLGTVSTNTFAIPAPFQANANTPVTGMPQNSFNALPSGERLMTIYNGTITAINYDVQNSLTTGSSDATTRVRIRFTAAKDSVVLAWGGHIASRLDWGFLPGTTTPRSASGISGSPYHMRQISMNTYPGLVNIPIGNQDRSLSAAAVVPPPSCAISPAQTVCPEAASISYSYTDPVTGKTFAWSINAGNTAGAQISGSTTGSSISVVPIAADFVGGGTFTVSLVVTQNGIPSQPCTQTGTIYNSPTVTVNSPIKCANDAAKTITATPGSGAGTDYNYVWTVPSGVTNPGNVQSFTASTAGSYCVVITNKTTNCVSAQGCGTLTVNPNPTVSVNSPTKCANDAAKTITATPGSGAGTDYDYAWTVPSGVTNPGNVQSFTASTAGSYCVVITNKTTTCASAQACGTLTVNPNPTVSVNSPIRCANDPAVTLTATPGSGAASDYDYAWTLGNPGNVQSFSATLQGNYCVVITHKTTGCASVQACGTLTVNANPGQPDAAIEPVSCTDHTFSVRVKNSISGLTYAVTQTTGYSSSKAGTGSDLIFTGLTFGDGFSVTATNDVTHCSSAPAICGGGGNVTKKVITDNNVIAPTDKAEVPGKEKLSKNIETFKIGLPSPTKVSAAPNPYNDRVRFSLTSGMSGYGTLELFDVLGQKVATVYQGYVQAGQELIKDYSITKGKRTTLIYVFKVGDQRITGKLIGQ